MLTIILLTLFCLNQNRAAGNLLFQGKTAVEFSVTSVSNEQVQNAKSSSAKISSLILGDQRCELSEKSLRLCLEQLSITPLLLVLFTLAFCFTITKTTVGFFNVSPIYPPKRIHLSFCKFQE